LYQVIKTALKRIAEDEASDLDERERELLRRATPHAFRHTFGTQAVAGEVPLDVVQKVLGHASLQTTTIYVQAEKKRSIVELRKLMGKTSDSAG
jgi:integrase